jgi:methylated-DNA-[protein]-cysteine S-methyltransferase
VKVSTDLDRRFRSAALAEGLLDISYALEDTPLGTLLLAKTERGLCRIGYDPDPDRDAEMLARVFGRRVLRVPGGSLVGYGGGLDRKQALLRLESAA